MTGLSSFLLYHGIEEHQRKYRKVLSIIAIFRVALVWILMLWVRNKIAIIVVASLAAAIYLVEYMFVYVKQRQCYERTGRYPKFTATNKFLYYLAHISVFNHVFDVCRADIKNFRVQHMVIIVANLATAPIIIFAYLFVDPYQRGWACYMVPLHRVWEFSRGLCPQFTDFGDVDTTANSGENNLICRDESFAAKQSLACTTGVIDASMPIYFHVAAYILTMTLVYSINHLYF